MNPIEVSEAKSLKDLASKSPQVVALAMTQLSAISLWRQGLAEVIMPDPNDDNTWLWSIKDDAN